MVIPGGSKEAGGSPPRGKPPVTPIRARVGAFSGVGAVASGPFAGRSGGRGLGTIEERSGPRSGVSSGESRGRTGVGVPDLGVKATGLVAGSAGVVSGLDGKCPGSIDKPSKSRIEVSAGAPLTLVRSRDVEARTRVTPGGSASAVEGGHLSDPEMFPGVDKGGGPGSRSGAVGMVSLGTGLGKGGGSGEEVGSGGSPETRASGGAWVSPGLKLGGQAAGFGASDHEAVHRADSGAPAAPPPPNPGSNVAESNRLFWEAKNARIRNRERGVGIKHFPTLLGARKITISLDQWNKGVEKLDNALVGFVFGEKPNLGRMRGYARARWQDRVKVAMLNDGIFLFKFTTEELRCDVLYGGPLTFNQKPLIFQRWTPDVSYTCSSVKSIPVWVRLPGLRAHFHEDEDLLGMVCSVIGKPLKTDGYTAEGDLMTFARVCVEIYSDQEFPDSVIIADPFDNDYVQEIKYEWLPKRCVNCCSFGHLKEECDMPSLETVESEEESDEHNEASKEGCEEEEDHCDPEDSLMADKDTREVLEEEDDVGSAGKIPDFSRDFLDNPIHFPDLPRKVQESPEESPKENTEECETDEGEVIPVTQDLPPAPSLTDELPNKVMEDFERQGDFVEVVNNMTPTMTDYFNETFENQGDFREVVIKKKPKGKGIVSEESSKESRKLRSSSRRGRGRGNKR